MVLQTSMIGIYVSLVDQSYGRHDFSYFFFFVNVDGSLHFESLWFGTVVVSQLSVQVWRGTEKLGGR